MRSFTKKKTSYLFREETKYDQIIKKKERKKTKEKKRENNG